ncbi:hypothetical protein BC834DRAFT_861732 [Gloeopeniophorella convolvens]|nr:hypothetical protein BC834DRAFT_861732 [Gloeopeniophorella convolvens]
METPAIDTAPQQRASGEREANDVLRLTVDILREIFSICATMNPVEKRFLSSEGREKPRLCSTGRPPAWLYISHVCRLWREVTLTTSTLWSDIPFSIGLRWTGAFFERSAETPLTVEWPVPRDTDMLRREAQLISSHIHHIRIFTIFGNQVCMKALAEAFESSAPILQKLVVCIKDSDESVEVPQDLFNGNAPQLRAMRTFGLRPNWTSPFLRRLTNLDISLDSNVLSAPSAQKILDVLESMDKLKFLKLMGCIRPFREAADGRIVNMSSLKRIILRGHVNACAGVLNHLRIPTSAFVVVEGCADKEGHLEPHLPNLLDALSNHLRRLKDPIRLLYHNCFLPTRRLYFELWDKVSDIDPVSGKQVVTYGKPKLQLDISVASVWGEEPSAAIAQVLRTVCTSLPLENTDSLVIRLPYLVQFWREVFGHMKHVQFLRLIASEVTPLFMALTMPGEESEGHFLLPGQDHSGVVLFPEIRKLTLEAAPDIHIHPFHAKDTTVPFSCNVLAASLAGRKRANIVPISTLNIGNCACMEQCVAVLREVVENIEWDDAYNFEAVQQCCMWDGSRDERLRFLGYSA